jgi:hypothetical protein
VLSTPALRRLTIVHPDKALHARLVVQPIANEEEERHAVLLPFRSKPVCSDTRDRSGYSVGGAFHIPWHCNPRYDAPFVERCMEHLRGARILLIGSSLENRMRQYVWRRPAERARLRELRFVRAVGDVDYIEGVLRDAVDEKKEPWDFIVMQVASACACSLAPSRCGQRWLTVVCLLLCAVLDGLGCAVGAASGATRAGAIPCRYSASG